MRLARVTRTERRTLRALAEVVKPRDDDVDLPIEDDMVDFFVVTMPRVAPLIMVVFHVGLFLVEWLPLFSGRRFRSLSRDERHARCERWDANPVMHLVLFGVQTPLNMGFYSDKRVWTHLRYNPDAWVAAAIARRDATYGAPEYRYDGGPSGYPDESPLPPLPATTRDGDLPAAPETPETPEKEAG